MANKIWSTPIILFIVLVIVVNIVIIGTIEWAGNNETTRIIITIIGIIITLGVYIQEYYYGKWLIANVIKGENAVIAFALGVFSAILVQAVIFFVMALYGEPFSSLPPITEAFHSFYIGFFPMATGVFLSAGNSYITPNGVASNVWWAWTCVVGAIHLYFIVGFFMARLIQYWSISNGKNSPKINMAMEFPPRAIAIKNREHPYSTKRRNRTPPRDGLKVFSLGGIIKE
jgi:hypothetical protein